MRLAAALHTLHVARTLPDSPQQFARIKGIPRKRSGSALQWFDGAANPGGRVHLIGVHAVQQRRSGTAIAMLAGERSAIRGHQLSGRARMFSEMFRGESIGDGFDSKEVEEALDLWTRQRNG